MFEVDTPSITTAHKVISKRHRSVKDLLPASCNDIIANIKKQTEEALSKKYEQDQRRERHPTVLPQVGRSSV